MSRKIGRLMNEAEASVNKLIKELETKNGFPSHDARLLAANSQALRRKLSDLSLDADDTTAEELYQALLVRFDKNSRLFETQFGAQELIFEDKASLAARLAANNFRLPERWALKNSVSRYLLRQLPPKHLMKHLKYRSVDSMLKREKTAELYLVAPFSEPVIWQKNLDRLVSKLEPTDFELRQVNIITLDGSKWSDIDGPDNWLASSDDIASAAIWPASGIKDASLLVLTLLLVDGLELADSHRPASLLSKASAILDWWAETDYLLAELGGQPVSLSVMDTALNSFQRNSFENRTLEHGRNSFWKELVSRYENLPPAEALFEEIAPQAIAKLKPRKAQPVFELAEDEFDG